MAKRKKKQRFLKIGLGVNIIVAIVKRWNLEFYLLEIVVVGIGVVLKLLLLLMMMMMMVISNE